jgi:hypothetical protein
MRNLFKYFKTSPEIIRLAVMMYVRFPLSLRNVEDLLHERGIDITHDLSPSEIERKAGAPSLVGRVRRTDTFLRRFLMLWAADREYLSFPTQSARSP